MGMLLFSPRGGGGGFEFDEGKLMGSALLGGLRFTGTEPPIWLHAR